MKSIFVNKLADVINADGDESLGKGGGDAVINGIGTDSRTVKKGDCFFAIKGPDHDGHDYIFDAVTAGAVCVVASRAVEPCGVPILMVDDTIEALGRIANCYRREMGFKVVAVTGSAGKTSTKQVIYNCLKSRFKCLRSPKSFNNAIGVPLTILAAEAGHEILILELGSNSLGEIESLSRMAEPDVALVTNVYPAHLEGFGSLDNIIKEKASICLGLRDCGSVGSFLINGAVASLVAYCDSMGREFTTFGFGSGCDIKASEIVRGGFSGELTIEETKVSVPLPGMANLSNVLSGWSVCKQLGVTIEQFAESVGSLRAEPLRLEICMDFPRLTVINDCYNANPASIANALDCLERIVEEHEKGVGRSVFICGEMAEMGKESDSMHYELGRSIAEKRIDIVLATGQFAGDVEMGVGSVQGSQTEVKVLKNTEELCNNLQEFIHPDDIILVKGSRCSHLEKAVARLRLFFPDFGVKT